MMLYLSHESGEKTIVRSRKIAMLFGERYKIVVHIGLRKLAHVFLYFVLSVLTRFALGIHSSEQRLLVCLGGLLLTAWADEYTKRYLNDRYFSLLDMILNIAGACLGMGLLL